MTHCTQVLQQRKDVAAKRRPPVADGVRLSVNKSEVVYISLISVENKVK